MKIKEELTLTTEQKIREAARKIFLQKGYEGTKIRDIAQEADINIALMNYYFRSKEKLFESVFEELMEDFTANMLKVVEDEELSLKGKITRIVHLDTERLKLFPMMPIFVMSELRNNPDFLCEKRKHLKQMTEESHFAFQIKEEIAQGRMKEITVFQLMISIIGMVTFPFISKPMVMSIGGFDEVSFLTFIEERKDLIPDIILNGVLKR